MDIIFTGSASAVPEPGRDTASLNINGTVQVDTGWCVALRLGHWGLDPLRFDFLLLTHCHHDHYMGLPQLLYARKALGRDRPDRPPLTVLGPAGEVEDVVARAWALLRMERSKQPEPEPVVVPFAEEDTWEGAGLRVDACPIVHSVPGRGYRITETATGACVAVSGDTAADPRIADLARSAYLLVHEAANGADDWPREQAGGHCSAAQAAGIARDAGVGMLALTHYEAARAEAVLGAARAVFPNTILAREGLTLHSGSDSDWSILGPGETSGAIE